MRPPHRSLASSIVTRLPTRASSQAAIRPAAPAPTTRKCVRCRGAAGISGAPLGSHPDASVNLRAFGGHSLLNGGTRQHARAMFDDARQFAGVDAVTLHPGRDGEQIRIADRVLVAHDPRTL